MAVTQLYEDYVRACIEAGADAIISGAGLPVSLPKDAEGSDILVGHRSSPARNRPVSF